VVEQIFCDGDVLLWLSHTDVCSARADGQWGQCRAGLMKGWTKAVCGCGAVMIVRLSLSRTQAQHCVERCGAMVTVGCSALWRATV